MTDGSMQVTVRLTGWPVWPEGPLVVGLQSGKVGLEPGDPDGDDVVFRVRLGVKAGRDGRPDFTGPLVHGRPGERFLYLSWGVVRPGHHAMFRRLKLYLGPLVRAGWEQSGIGWDLVQGGSVAVDVSAVLPDGTPACGTAPAPWRSDADGPASR